MPTFSLSTFDEVVPGVWRAVAQPEAVNIGVVVGETGCLVIDTGSSPAQGAAIRDEVERATGRPVTAVVVTHDHSDHFFGLAGFGEVPSYAHETVRPDGESVAAAAAELGLDPANLAAPTVPFALARALDLGGIRAELVHFGPGHTGGDVVVIVPEAKVVFAGDLLEQSAPPSYGPDSHPIAWPTAIDGMLGVLGGDWLLIPGHGEPVDRFFAFNQRAEISAIYGQVEHLIGRGVREADAHEQGTWPDWPADVIEGLIPHVYAALAATGRVPRAQLPLA